jgi:outer membrane protein TolC
MIIKKKGQILFFSFIIGWLCSLLFPGFSLAEKQSDVFTLKYSIESAVKANIELKVSKEEARAALFAKKQQQTRLFPTFNATYQLKRNNEEFSAQDIGVISPRNEYTFVTRFTQPVFTGFSLINRYKIAGIGLEVAMVNEKLVRQTVIFEAKKIFFSLLKAQKLVAVAQEAVKQIEAHKEVANNFYQVGMTPLNELLKAEVELANARQDLIVAQNNLEIAESNFNNLLRRPINKPVKVQDILKYSPFENSIDYCIDTAVETRLEITIADLEVEILEKELKIAQKNYFPELSLQGNYYQTGTDWDAKGGIGVFGDSSSWDIRAIASWDFWEWGRSFHDVKEKTSRLAQARYRQENIQDNIRLEVKQAYLKTKESEKNIITVNKAIEQAKENLRINQERYKEQMSTSTDVLDAQTLLTRTMTNYYNALYDFKISKAALHRAMGREFIE